MSQAIYSQVSQVSQNQRISKIPLVILVSWPVMDSAKASYEIHHQEIQVHVSMSCRSHR